ncbi:MAG: hypothetical protein MJZ94_11705, partial [Bacteroidales bacterium]|nr:hypothetical protein [Bacteroidales bacterium]
ISTVGKKSIVIWFTKNQNNVISTVGKKSIVIWFTKNQNSVLGQSIRYDRFFYYLPVKIYAKF